MDNADGIGRGAQSFQRAVATPTSVMAKRVMGVLGPERTVRALGVADARTVRQWIDSHNIRGADPLLRLRTVFQIISELERCLDDDQIVGWFSALNPAFGLKPAIDVLNDDPLEEVGARVLAAAIDDADRIGLAVEAAG